MNTFEACVRADLLWETLRQRVEKCISPPSGPSPDCRCSYCKEEFETRRFTALSPAWIRTARGLESI